MDQRAFGTKSREAALTFLKCFCAGNIEGLEALLAGGLQVNGPLYRFSSRDAYLVSLRDDPPEPSTYRVLGVTEDENVVAVFYDYDKPDGSLTVAQLFRFENGLIAEMRLVFDTDGMAQP